ncbi:acyltransferase [Halalkalibacter kiskunsagensis]|uniref:Acyltransferase n=1 Tax=Halalkalibacter kiskunsagensis TaxID=1548599 RepID=A0ABV6KGV5_9BACI
MELQESINNLATEITGKNNTLHLPESVKLNKVRLFIHGTGNEITIGEDTILNNLFIEIKGNNNKVKIGAKCKLRGHMLISGARETIKIGSKTTFQHNCYLLASENKNITIGRDCMFSNSIDVRTSDAHSVIDVETGVRKNVAQDVVIGNHVWISAGALISKGAVIPDDCIVGGRAVVTKKFEETNCTLAGTPAKVVSRGVTWDRQRL